MGLPLVLAQQSPLAGSSSVPPLPSPPFLAHHFLESPATVAGTFAILGALLFFILERRGKATYGIAAGGLLVLLGAATVLLACSIETTRETLAARTREIIALVARRDSAAVAPALAPDVSLAVLGVPFRWDRERLLRAVEERLAGDLAIKEHSVTSTSATLDGPDLARTQARIRVNLEAFGMPTSSWWRLTWRHDPDGPWRIIAIEALQIDAVSQSMVAGEAGR
ncbi:MAG: hypothetical protein KF745_08695 [Phycisphaeraceae bacterium]|nr:hypothetical protein [Phycisphaeraceae bacterium]